LAASSLQTAPSKFSSVLQKFSSCFDVEYRPEGDNFSEKPKGALKFSKIFLQPGQYAPPAQRLLVARHGEIALECRGSFVRMREYWTIT
jgi:hypothetical protein